MKAKLFSVAMVVCSALLFNACTPQLAPLKGVYLDKPFQVTIDKSVDEVWSDVIDFFATNGISIKIIDKGSGLIVSEKTNFRSNYTFEDANGNLINQNAWIVLSKITYAGTEMTPEKVTGEWNVRIRSNEDGKTLFNVNLTNIEATTFVPASQYTAAQNLDFGGKSTGKFEELIANSIQANNL